jgi:hypothetical protein
VRRFVFKPRWILGHLFVVAAAYTCIRLADWQLSRAHITEALQNWGYALQWPLFSVFFLIGWWRMLKLESIRLDEIEAEEAAALAGGTAPDGPASGATASNGAVLGAAASESAGSQVSNGTADDAPISKAEARRRARQRPPLTAPILPPASQPPHPGAVPAAMGPTDPEDEQLAAYNRMLAKLASQDAARDEARRR